MVSEFRMFFSSQQKQLFSEEWKFVKLITSYFSTHIAKVSLSFITIFFAGTLGQAYLDGVGLACTLYRIIATSMAVGYSFVFETYGPQVYGPSQSGELTTVLIKCLLQGVMVHLVMMGPYLNLVYVIDLLPQSGLFAALENGDIELVEDSSVDFRDVSVQFLRMTMLFQLLEYAVFMNSTYFAIQGQTKFVYIIVCGVMAGAHFLANYIFVSVLKLGVKGLGIAGFTGRFLALAVSIAICFFNVKNGRFQWKGLSKKILLGWKPMIKLGIYGAVFIFVDVSMFEVSSFLSKFVSTATLSAVIIVLQMMCVFWSVVIAISLAASNLIGQALAEGNASKVKQSMRLTLFNTILALVPTVLISYSLRVELVRLFTQDPEVIDLFTNNIWLVILGIAVEFLHMSINYGILTAFGQQRYAAFATCASYTFIGLPFIITLIFMTNLGLTGILIGWIMADTILLLAAVFKIFRNDIEAEIEKSHQRVVESISTYGSLDKADKREFGNLATLDETKKLKLKAESESIQQDIYTRESLDEEASPGKDSENVADINQEVKTVLCLFVIFGIFYIALVSISFLRS